MNTIEWKEATAETPKEGVVLGLMLRTDIQAPVVFVPLLGWYEVGSDLRMLVKREVKFWAPFNLPK